jgi:hypothetical protein
MSTFCGLPIGVRALPMFDETPRDQDGAFLAPTSEHAAITMGVITRTTASFT